MTQTVVLAAGTTATESSDIVVTDTPKTVSLFFGNVPTKARTKLAHLVRRIPDDAGVVNSVSEIVRYRDERGVEQEAIFDVQNREYTIVGPGTYRVSRLLMSGGVNPGFAVDDTT